MLPTHIFLEVRLLTADGLFRVLYAMVHYSTVAFFIVVEQDFL